MAPDTPSPAANSFALSSLVVGPADVNRLLLEMEALEDYMRQARLRRTTPKPPKTSRTLEDLVAVNGADLADDRDRLTLQVFLESLQQHAPVIHISFASEPSAAFTIKIVDWLRANISSFALVQVGLQPSIAAGCIVRTTSQVFDLSLGRLLRAQRHLLTEALHNTGATTESKA